MALTVADLSSLKSSLKFWEAFEYLATAIVLLGVIGEYIAEFTKWAANRRIERRLGKGSTLVLIVGIAGEGLGLFRTSQLSGELIASLEEQSNQTFERAIKVEAKVKGFKIQIADANARAKEADARAAEASLALAKLKAPRALESEQQRRIIAKIRVFAGSPFEFVGYDDPESVDFARTIAEILLGAGWKIAARQTNEVWMGISLLPDIFMRTGPVSGILIQVAPSRLSNLGMAARALASALAAEGIVAKMQGNSEYEKTPNAIYVIIGKKKT
jgi:hypothetical protein